MWQGSSSAGAQRRPDGTVLPGYDMRRPPDPSAQQFVERTPHTSESRAPRGSALVGQYTSPGRSAAGHKRLVGGLAALGLLAGIIFAFVRPPTYTATSTAYVGKTLSLNNTAAIAGLANAATQIAGDYARLISTASVTNTASKELGHPGDLGGTLAASQIPETPEILITATAGDEATAIRLANAGSSALIKTVSQLNAASEGQLKSLLASYQSLEKSISSSQQQVQSLQAQITSLESRDPGSSQLSGLQSQLSDAQTQVSTDTLQANAVESQYQTQYAPLQQETQVIAPLSAASSAGSDRKKALELGAIVGLAAGLLLGVVLASFSDLRVSPSRYRRTA
jgi:capsular polysaccharide biosynthesis protein